MPYLTPTAVPAWMTFRAGTPADRTSFLSTAQCISSAVFQATIRTAALLPMDCSSRRWRLARGVKWSQETSLINMKQTLVIVLLIAFCGCSDTQPPLAAGKWVDTLHGRDPKLRQKAAFTLGNI